MVGRFLRCRVLSYPPAEGAILTHLLDTLHSLENNIALSQLVQSSVPHFGGAFIFVAAKIFKRRRNVLYFFGLRRNLFG